MENISELKNESEKFVSEEEALTQRIMKWQQDVLMEQEKPTKLESGWVEDSLGTVKVTEHAAESYPHPNLHKGKDPVGEETKRGS